MINGILSIASCLFLIPTLVSTYQHKKVVGVHWITPTFFTFYGFWNLDFYWHLGQIMSMGASGAMLICNAVWLAMVVRYSRPI